MPIFLLSVLLTLPAALPFTVTCAGGRTLEEAREGDFFEEVQDK